MELISPINLFTLIITISLSITCSDSSGCSFALNGDIPKTEQPLYLQKRNNKHFEIIHPLGDNLVLEKDAKIYLACSGTSNYLLPPDNRVYWDNDSNVIEAKCVNRNTLMVSAWDRPSRKRPRNEYVTYQVNLLKCKRNITGDVRLAGQKCASDKGDFVEVGFDVSGRNIFVSSFRTCFDGQSKSVIYAEELLNITTGGQKFDTNQEFRISKILKDVHPDRFYTKNIQRDTFGRWFPKFDEVNYFFARGHMAPVKDFPYESLKRATYYYINAIPQWQVINNGNWKRVENNARLLNSRNAVEIYTGVYGSLTYKDRNNNDVKAYMDVNNKRIEVPRWTWKIILSREDRTSGIAFVTLNDPFVTDIKKVVKLCDDRNVCKDAGFQDDLVSFRRLNYGYTYCCRVEGLKKKIPYVATDVTVTRLLRNVGRETGYQDDVVSFERFDFYYTYCCHVDDLKRVVPYIAQDVTVITS